LKRSNVAILAAVLVILAGPTLIMFAMQISLNNPYPILTVRSGSMVPTINVGDLIVVRGTPASDIQVSDIIVFHQPGSTSTLIVHRVIGIQIEGGEIFFSTKGDHNGVADPWQVPQDGLVGKVIANYAIIGWIFIGLEILRPVLFIVLAIAAIVFLVLFMRDRSTKKVT
jgi:signal peptidase I